MHSSHSEDSRASSEQRAKDTHGDDKRKAHRRRMSAMGCTFGGRPPKGVIDVPPLLHWEHETGSKRHWWNRAAKDKSPSPNVSPEQKQPNDGSAQTPEQRRLRRLDDVPVNIGEVLPVIQSHIPHGWKQVRYNELPLQTCGCRDVNGNKTGTKGTPILIEHST
jgi:hypothetical protein